MVKVRVWGSLSDFTEGQAEVEVEALGGLFLEPLMLFARPDRAIAGDPSRWGEAEARIAVGAPGSGRCSSTADP